MRKFWKYIRTTPLNPIIPIIFFIILGGITFIMLEDNKNVFEYFLSCIGIGISIAVVQCAFIQNQIQKYNIKIQLFDKRYSVFQCVLSSVTIIKRNNWDRYILFNKNDINEQMLQIEENLYNSTQLSMCLFDKDIYSKLVNVNNAFCKVAKSYKDMLIKIQGTFTSKEAIEEYSTIVNLYILSPNGFRTKEYEEELKNKFPRIYINLMDFSKECESYLSLIDATGIIQDLGNYIIVYNLEK